MALVCCVQFCGAREALEHCFSRDMARMGRNHARESFGLHDAGRPYARRLLAKCYVVFLSSVDVCTKSSFYWRKFCALARPLLAALVSKRFPVLGKIQFECLFLQLL